MNPPVAILDVDGTLVDSNYHHSMAWFRAFAEHDVTPPIWRIHRHIGMGGDQLVGAVAGEEVENRCGSSIREAESRLYAEFIDEVRLLEGATRLIDELHRRGNSVVLASSAKEEEVQHYLDLLDRDDRIAAYTTSADVEETKPEPDLVLAALGKAEGAEAVMVGDTNWDVEAATRAGVPTVGVLSGGFSSAELTDAGAVAVYESPGALAEDMTATPLVP